MQHIHMKVMKKRGRENGHHIPSRCSEHLIKPISRKSVFVQVVTFKKEKL